MKSFYVFSVLIIACYSQGSTVRPISEEFLENLKAMSAECAKKSGIHNFVQLLYQGQLINNDVYKQHLVCLYKADGIMNEDGTLNRERAIDVALEEGETRDYAEEVADKCNLTGPNEAETAWLWYQCFLENNSIIDPQQK